MQIVRPITYQFADCVVSLPEDEAPVWLAGTTYALNDQVIRDHRVFVSAIDGNVGIDPLLEDQALVGVRWVLKGNTNAFKFMDGVLSNKSVGTGQVDLTVGGILGADTVVLFGVTGSTLAVTGRSLSNAIVMQRAFNISGREVNDWFDWFFAGFEAFADKVVVDNVPANVSSIDISVAGGLVEVGEVIAGTVIKAGTALPAQTDGEAISYSRIDFNAYGELNLIKRPVRNEMRYGVHVDANRWRSIKPLMDRMQGDLVAAIGDPDRPSTIHLGILGTVRWSENLPDDYIFQFTLRGVI